MKILGINALNHDAEVTLIQDGEVLFIGHSERYNGIEFEKKYGVKVF